MKTTDLKSLQEQAITLLIAGNSITDTAKALEIDRGTLYNWLNNNNFESEYNQMRAEYKEQARNNLLHLYSEAIETIKKLLNSQNETISFKTAIFILQSVLDYDTKQQTEQERKDSLFNF
mgnify:CR=1 FL=1